MKLFDAFCIWVKHAISRWWSGLQDAIIEKKWKRTVFYLLAAVCLISLVTAAVFAIVNLIVRHGFALVERFWPPLAIIVLIGYFVHRGSRATQDVLDDAPPDSLGESFALANWINVANMLMAVLKATASRIGLVAPMSIEDIDCPTARVISRGKVVLYQFSIPKANASATIDLLIVKNVLQQSITNGLNHASFEGISEAAVLVDGVSYPTYMIDEVKDVPGYVSLLIAQPSAAYINQLRLRKQAAYAANNTSNRPPMDSEL